MAYSLETSSVKTIVPGAEVSGFCDVVARQKINEVSGEVPQLSAGEGIDISTVDGKTVITNNISAGSNISLVYDMETNTYRIDSNAGGVSSLVLTASAQPDQFVNWLAGSGYWGIQDGIEVTDSATNVGGLVVKTRTSARNADNYFDTDASLDSNGLILSNSHGRTQRTQYNKTSLNINSSAVKYTSAVKSNPEGEPIVTSYSATWKQIIDAANGGGDTFPIVSSDDSTPNYKYIYELDGTASGIKSTYTNSSTWMESNSSTEVSPDKIVLQTSATNAAYPSEVIITDNKVSKLWYADTYRSKSWDDIIKPTIEWNSATDFHAMGSGADLRVWYHEGDPSASYSWSGIKLTKKYNTVLSSLYINSTGVSSYSAGNALTLPQSATWKQIIEAANGGGAGLYVPLSATECEIGSDNYASGSSLAQGTYNSAYSFSYAQGNANSACWQSMAQGERNISHNQSLTQGTTNSAVNYSQALGDANTASYYSFAAGNRNFASRHTQALGYKLNISGGLASGGMAIGSCNKLSSDVSFVVGNGTSTANRSDAFVIYPDGRVSAAGKISANGVELGAGKTYTGIAPVVVNNNDNTIAVTNYDLSAGPNMDIFQSGGYVVFSSRSDNPFPITGTNGTTGFTATVDCSSFAVSTGAGPAGAYTKQTVRGVQYEAYPATDVSASWYNIITATNNRSNCYCIRFTNDMTAASLEDYSAYDKVTVVHSNEYTPDCMLYWDGNTKVFPSGLYCELVKGTNDQNQTDWFFTTSGWINNVEWDWD